MEESLEDVMKALSRLYSDVDFQELQTEILATALVELRDNPNKTIKDCLWYGYNEWIK